VGIAFRTAAVCGVLAGCAGVRDIHSARAHSASPHVSCDDARASAIETLRVLGYAIAASYEPIPQRVAVVAVEKQSTRGRFQATVTVRCDDRDVEVIGGRSAPPPHDQFEEHLRASWRERGGGRVAAPRSATATTGPVARFELLAAGDARERFGGDVAAAGLVAARLAISNSTARPYVVSVPLIGMLHPTGDLVRPLPWTGARARLEVSGRGWKPYDEIERQLVTDQVLQPGASVSGIIFYPIGEYADVDLVLIDQTSARSERFQAPLPPSPRVRP
jgi:hypothetical protein